MASLNKVILLGNITKDPEFKRSASGAAVVKLRLAVNEQFRDRVTGQAKEVACYVDVTVWDRQAEACSQFLQKGSQIIVDGRLVYEEWKTPNGEARNKLSVRADRVQFLDKTKRQAGAPTQGGQPVQGQASQQGGAAAAIAATAQPPPADDPENLPF